VVTLSGTVVRPGDAVVGDQVSCHDDQNLMT